MTPRPCITCGTPTNTTRCPPCHHTHNHQRNTTRPHYQHNWPTLSRTIRQAWVNEHGWTCPGWNRDPHPSTDLTVDHIQQRTTKAGLQVLCRSCNSRKSATERHPSNKPPTTGGGGANTANQPPNQHPLLGI